MSPLDCPMGLQLAHLWADIEPDFNPNVSIAFALRYDMDMATVPTETIEMLRRKFKAVHVFKSALVGSGWPHGCNALEIGAYQWFVERTRDGSIQEDYLLLCEPDTIPLRPTWLEEIRQEALTNKSPIMGAYFTAGEGVPHINGNCVIHKDFWRECKEIWSVPPMSGWDIYIGKTALRLGKASRLIWQDYRLGAPDNPWRGPDHLWESKCYHGPENPLYGQALQPAMLHGIKTYEGIDAVRERFKLGRRIS